MTPWTDTARKEVENYFARIRPSLSATGADADEVIEDLRRHLEAEVVSARLGVVTEEDVRRLLARIGAPAAEPAATTPTVSPPPPPPTTLAPPPKVGVLLLLAGVVLPIVTLVIELATGMCAGAFFDPMPSLWHGLLVALVPLGNWLVWEAVRHDKIPWRPWLGWVSGAAIGVAFFYALLFLPLLLPGLFALIFLGWGLLPWSPMLALISAVVLRQRLKQMAPGTSLPGLWRGLGLAGLALALIQAPGIITRVGLNQAAGESTTAQRQAIRWLRVLGSEDQLLRACYGQTRGAAQFDLLGWIFVGGEQVSPEKAREVYFRVAGRPFNSVPAPTVRTARGAFADLNEWTWDADHGGDQVGGRLKGLGLNSSRQDTLLEPDAATSYTEWTLEFRNDSTQDREARAQILLPPGGVVSRLTLWVNGEEREAAFAGRSQTREAYQKIAVQQRRDPVLVTTCGPDRVLMQCFPVPRGGGLMKVRLGITAPLVVDRADEGRLRLPLLLERNFSLREGVRHAVWAEAPTALTAATTQLVAEVSRPGFVALRGQLDNAELVSHRALLRVARDPAKRFSWVRDVRGPDGQFIRQELREEVVIPPTQVIFVVDGSRDMAAHMPALVQALGSWRAAIPVQLVWAADDVLTIPNSPNELFAAKLLRLRPRGGQDNVPALERAWNLAVQTPGSVILWVHGPQPMLLSPLDALLQAGERTAQPPKLYELQTEPGPDRILEKLDGQRFVRPVVRQDTVATDLTNLVNSWTAGGRQWRANRERVDSEAAARADNAGETSLHLARLWAAEEIRRLQSKRDHDAAVKLAGLYQVVTPVSGAVVLENQQQYAQTGLTPVDAQSVPAIPEPGAIRLMLLGWLAWLTLRRRHRQQDGFQAR
jgi:hypothetical protein